MESRASIRTESYRSIVLVYGMERINELGLDNVTDLPIRGTTSMQCLG